MMEGTLLLVTSDKGYCQALIPGRDGTCSIRESARWRSVSSALTTKAEVAEPLPPPINCPSSQVAPTARAFRSIVGGGRLQQLWFPADTIKKDFPIKRC